MIEERQQFEKRDTAQFRPVFKMREPGVGFEDAMEPIQIVEFPFREIETALGEVEVSVGPERCSEVLAMTNTLLARICDLGTLTPRKSSQFIGRRVTAFCWLVSPSAFGGISLSQLAKRLGVSKQLLSKYAAEFSRRFGIENSAQQCGRGGRHRQRLKKAPPGEGTGGDERESETREGLIVTGTSTQQRSEVAG